MRWLLPRGVAESNRADVERIVPEMTMFQHYVRNNLVDLVDDIPIRELRLKLIRL